MPLVPPSRHAARAPLAPYRLRHPRAIPLVPPSRHAARATLVPCRSCPPRATPLGCSVVPSGPTSAVPCLLYTSPSPRDAHESRMPSAA
eukprot:2976569-Prymnesium_polylepis.1